MGVSLLNWGMFVQCWPVGEEFGKKRSPRLAQREALLSTFKMHGLTSCVKMCLHTSQSILKNKGRSFPIKH